jgi:hypothetical protein
MRRPPEFLESFFARLIPPACREEVLGDLSEKYAGPLQYFFLAVRTVPFVIVSRARRTTSPAVLLTDPLLIYGGFLLEAWFAHELPPADVAAFLRPAFPAALTWIYMLACEAFAPDTGKRATLETRGLPFMFVVMAMGPGPWFFGFCTAMILVSCTRFLPLFAPSPRRTQFANSRFSRAAAALFAVSYVLLHFPAIFSWIGGGIWVAVMGYGLIKRRAAKSDSRRDPL